jgi:hypothetical protein
MSKVEVLNLRPTQFAVGMREVETKVAKLEKFSHSEREEFLRARPVPVVLGPQGEKYLIDHHHLVRAAWEAGIDDVLTEVKADLGRLKESDFWDHLRKEGWVYLHDQFGKGPHAPEFLPMDVRSLADDPFRSLAWALRDEKGFEKSPIPFCEFRWAEFLRKHIAGHPIRKGFHHSLKEALELCHLPEAKKLPGYIEKK